MSNNSMKNKGIGYYLEIAAQEYSLPEEIANNWEEWVAHPVIAHNMAPREARAVLEVVGSLLDLGYSISDLLGLLLGVPPLTTYGISGAAAGKELRAIYEDWRNK